MKWKVCKLPAWSLEVTPKSICHLLHLLRAAVAAGMCMSAWIMGTYFFCASIATFCSSRSTNPAITWHAPKTPSLPSDAHKSTHGFHCHNQKTCCQRTEVLTFGVLWLNEFTGFSQVQGCLTKVPPHPSVILEEKSRRSFITYDGASDVPSQVSWGNTRLQINWQMIPLINNEAVK